MGALTNYYVDPSGGSDTTGNGTSGNPWQTVQKALNTITRDTTNGDKINVKAGGTDTLSSALSFATYGTPSATAPLMIRGYTSSADDGGIGTISGGGSVAIINSGSVADIKLVDMHLTNCGAATIVTLGGRSLLLNCELDTTTGGGFTSGTNNSSVINCFFHNIGAIGCISQFVAFCTFRNETNDFTNAIQTNQNPSTVIFNIIDIDGSSAGVNCLASNTVLMFNSIFSNGGTGIGLKAVTTSNTALNNTVQGFSGAGGIGLQANGSNVDIVGYNLLYNNTTNTSITGDVNVNLANNDTAGSSPFTNAGSDDFDPIAGLFASYPSYPTAWKSYSATQQNLIRMAAQYAAAAAGGALVLGGTVIR